MSDRILVNWKVDASYSEGESILQHTMIDLEVFESCESDLDIENEIETAVQEDFDIGVGFIITSNMREAVRAIRGGLAKLKVEKE